jgi:mannitol operon transcriptional antiterminator
MYVTARERQILQRLLNEDQAVTVRDLAVAVQVSERTVHRDLNHVEDILSAFDLSLEKKTGIGIRIRGAPERKKQLELFLLNEPPCEFTPHERQTILLCSLLAQEDAVKLVALADELNVTVATVSHDLTKVEQWLASFSLSLVRKRGYGVKVVGPEAAKRRAMSRLIMENLSEADLLVLLRDQIRRKSAGPVRTVSERLLGYVGKDKLAVAERAVEEIRTQLPYALTDSAYIGLVVHLALALERLQKGEKIVMDASSLAALQDTREYRIAAKIIDKLRKALDLEVPEAEIGYIAMHLKGAKLREGIGWELEEENVLLAARTKRLIDYVSEQTRVDLHRDPSLFRGLITHLQPAIYRIQKELRIDNPLLEDIKRDYGDWFALIRTGVERAFPEVSFPEAEIGYLVLHFASSLEQRSEPKDIRALIICASGIGTSKMLAAKVKKELQEVQRLHHASVFDLEKINLDDYDVIISTIPLEGFGREYILVHPMLTEADARKIREAVRKRRPSFGPDRGHFPRIKDREAGEKAGDHRRHVLPFRRVHRLAEIIGTVLEGFRLTVLENPKTVEHALRSACEELHRRGVLRRPEEVAEALLQRHRMRGLGIPGSSLGLFHARSPQVQQPSFTIWSWAEPLSIRAMDDTRTGMNRLLLLLAPESPSNQVLEVLSHISALIIEGDESLAVFESQDQETVASFLGGRFQRFLKDQLDG